MSISFSQSFKYFDLIIYFPWCSGAGAHLFKSWATYMNRSIILTPEVISYVSVFNVP